MYLMENQLEKFKITKPLIKELLDSKTNETIYSFDCNINCDIPLAFTPRIFITTKDDSEEAVIVFRFIIDEYSRKEIKQIKKNVSDFFFNNKFKDFFFYSGFPVSVEPHFSGYLGAIKVVVKLKGKLRFNTLSEFNYLNLLKYEDRLKQLKNEETLLYLETNIDKITSNIFKENFMLKKLVDLFDINSNDFLEALKLHYDY